MKTKFEIGGTILTVLALWLISEQMLLIGFAINIIGGLAWIGYAKEVKGYGLMIVNIILILININGIANIT